MGLHRAGYEVVGVDIKPQPRYPFEFHQGDAMEWPLEGLDLIWASPLCQAFTNARVIHGREHPDLLTPLRDRFKRLGIRSWVIENVPNAPMKPDVILCGSMFPELRVRRHRWFEFGWPFFALVMPCDHSGDIVSVFGHGGHIYHGVEDWREAMGIDWMNRDELAQAIPPAYSEWLGRRILEADGAA